jgi:hypothetical protein
MSSARPPNRLPPLTGRSARAQRGVAPRQRRRQQKTAPPQLAPPHELSVIDFEKMATTFVHRYTEDLFPRQAACLKRIVRERRGGLVLDEWPRVAGMIDLALQSLRKHGEDGRVLVEPLCALVRLHGVAYAKANAYQTFEALDVLTASFQLFGRALTAGHPRLVHAVADTVHAFLRVNNSDFVENQLHYEVIAESEIVPQLLVLLEAALVDDAPLARSVLDTCRDCARVPVTAGVLTEAGFFDLVAVVLEDHTERRGILQVTLDVVWNMLDSDELAAERYGDERNVLLLTSTLTHLLATSTGGRDKELRNQVLVILLLLSKHSSNTPFFASTPALRLVLRHCTHAELYGDGSYQVRPTKLFFKLKRATVMFVVP